MAHVSTISIMTKAIDLTIRKIERFRVGTSLDDREFDLLKVLALDTSALLQSLLRFRKWLVRYDLESKRNAV